MDAARRLRAAMEAKDHAAVVALFADDIVLHSPILRTKFEGRQALSDLYAGIIEGFTDYRYTAEYESGDACILEFAGAVRGRPLQGVDIVRVNDAGEIAEMTVMIRPLSGLIGFLVGVGPHIARRRGRWQALVLRIVSPPLPLVAALVDRLSPRLVRTR
jgi:hypothetical protein